MLEQRKERLARRTRLERMLESKEEKSNFIYNDEFDFYKNNKKGNNGCTQEFLDHYYDGDIDAWIEDNKKNKNCFNCKKCVNCKNCFNMHRCGYCEDCELCVWCHHLTSCIFCCDCYDLFNCLDCYEIEGYDNVEGNSIDNEDPLKLKFTKDGKDVYKLYKNELFMLDDNPSFDDTFNGDFDDEYEEIFGPNLLRKYFE